MRHAAKIEWWMVLIALAGVLAPLESRTYWASGIVAGVALISAFPQSHETTPRGLKIRTGLTRRLIPYGAITFIGPSPASGGGAALAAHRVKIGWGRDSEVLIAPANPSAFFADMAARTPHLSKRGPDLVGSYL
ncbi:MAG: PH domain-containing protein [Acidobacteriia bacterium]|nr:PH domain-containing protein [Terriglobia bacterium]